MNDDTPIEKQIEFASLLSAVAARNEIACEELHRRYKWQVYATLFGIVGLNPADVDDCAQTAWLKIFYKIKKGYVDLRKGSFEALIRKLARNVGIDELRKRGRMPEILESDLIRDDSDTDFSLDSLSKDGDLEGVIWDTMSLNECMARLADSCPNGYIVIFSYYIEGLILEEIAKDLRIPIATVFRIKRRAMKKLRDCLEGKQAREVENA